MASRWSAAFFSAILLVAAAIQVPGQDGPGSVAALKRMEPQVGTTKDGKKTGKGIVWAETNGPAVAEFAKTCDTAVIPVGCVEMHGPHIPTGTDSINAERACRLAAEQETFIILPTIYYNINDQMMSYPGTISIPHRILIDTWRAIFKECARNGFKRIVPVCGHGGSQEPLIVAQAEVLQEAEEGTPIDYQVFRIETWNLPSDHPELGGHGGGEETARVMDALPGLVDLSKATGEGPYLKPIAAPADYRIPWIRNVPKGYEGRPELASRELGDKLSRELAAKLVDIIRKIKAVNLKTSP
jgi:creatinine amidohydrolase